MNITKPLSWIAAALLIPVVLTHNDYSDSFQVINSTNGCTTAIRRFDPLLHKSKYRVGVYTSEGEEAVFRMYNLTFAKYLTMTAGRKFDPPVEFDLLPVTLDNLMHLADDEAVDFFFASAAVSSCMATEYKAQPLVTIINRREYRGHMYDLDMYGGVMFSLANNTQVNSLDDFKDKIIGAGGLTAMGGGQTQFYEMVRHGLSYAADPKQVIFTVDEALTVQGVLDGEFDIGFARTDQIERHRDENGEVLRTGTFKVFNPQRHVMDDGSVFPFLVSTDLHPEWPVAALDHVPQDMAREVQEALLALRDHYTALEIGRNMRCETTPELAELAMDASRSGLLAGFRTARSYFEVKTKQETAGFMTKKDGSWHCIRGETLYEDIQCPEHHYKIMEHEFDMSCELVGLPCKEGYECYCKPCIRAYEVDVFQKFDQIGGNATVNATPATRESCAKMSLCGHVEQNELITFRIVDNRKRIGAEINALMHLESEQIILDVHKVPDEPWTYELHWSEGTVGVGIMEIFFDGEQIPESPIRVQVLPRDCATDYPGKNMVPSEAGYCVCANGSIEFGDNCLGSEVIAVVSSIAVVIIVAVVAFSFTRYKNHKNDQMWLINVEELHFDDPLEIIGQGSFGVVLLAEYRGTKVAIKRAIKMGQNSTRGSRSRTGSKNSAGAKSIGSSQDTSENTTNDLEIGLKEGNDNENERDRVEHSVERLMSTNSYSLGFLEEDFGQRNKWAWLFPWMKRKDYHSRFKEAVLGGSASLSHKSLGARLCPWFNEQARREEEFVSEMRVLSRLRHPCITTVMGAVMSHRHEPMLVMEYMEYGSLHDLLRNETMYLSGEIIMQITRDVAQGLRYLHSSKPPILHGDLKARNILVDARFRAKLCDFGLSTKKANHITGSPFWLAPEYLRGQTSYNATCDMYSVGIIFYEIYSRKNPYQGQNFRDILRKVCDRRVNKRPVVPDTCPPKMVELMKKCWSPHPTLRPQAKDLDMTLMNMNPQDVEPLEASELNHHTGKPGRRTGDMLYELFPKHIADALNAGQKVEPEHHDMVTLVFSDIVHFTDISREISPLKVSTMLDRLYLAFDKIANKHGVFKVETIGDAYMGVTNLENNQEDTHVKRVAEFAVDMINEASKILIDEEAPEKGYINIRVGFHSGPVVSNVIGSLNPRYGLFGDTVNTASRMESNSKPNRILCSEKAYMLLKEQAPQLPKRKRGKIAVKGKGDMNTFWIGDGLINVSNAAVTQRDGRSVGFEDTSDQPSEHLGVDECALVTTSDVLSKSPSLYLRFRSQSA